jgi:hypothetical protein
MSRFFGEFGVISMKFAFCLALAVPLSAQAPAPTAYTVTQTSFLTGAPVNMVVHRDGSKALVDSTSPGSHTNTFYDLETHRSYTWVPGNSAPSCSTGTFSGDWGDPFAATASAQADLKKQNAKAMPDETVNGFASKVFAISNPAFSGKAWIDSKSGLLVKMEWAPKDGKTQTIMELKQYSLARPAANLFTLPASCKLLPAPQTAPSDGTVDAMMPPPSKESCSPTFKVAQAGSKTPITSGFQVAIDTKIDLEHPAGYKIAFGAGGHATFAGGSLHEVTSQLANGALRIDNAPPYWDLEVELENGGSASALIYRQCFGAQPLLMMVVKNPAKLSDGVEWRWVKQ